ncbi:hypothetical protein [Massilia sp. YIM B02443]|uniref:hypothetical protein n=1 Tax=Massilia sp. YIM B02443 TaxID=3050127 RepID=UPI0025B6873E|nr:hypothetical protein [Massilia sp. YIM B02443]MDN4036755.1 hypothetical protein [Massilia sp. YIM B02443]
MHDRHHVLHHFLFWREAFLVQYQHFTTTLMCYVLEPRVPESRQAIPMRQHQNANLASPNRVGQRQ